MIGPQLTSADVNGTVGQLARQLYGALDNIRLFQAWLAATPDATLLAAPFGMAQADINTLKSAMIDADKLRTIFEGTATQASTYDFRTFLKQALGVGLF